MPDESADELAGHDVAGGVELINGIGGCVPVDVLGAVVEVDEVDGGIAEVEEGLVVVEDLEGDVANVALEVGLTGGLMEEFAQAGCGVGRDLELEVLVANHVGENHGTDAAALLFKADGEVAAAVEAVGGGVGVVALFSIEEGDEDVVLEARRSGEDSGEFEHKAGGAAAVVGALEVGGDSGLGIVVGEQDDPFVACAFDFAEDVVEGLDAFRRGALKRHHAHEADAGDSG